MKRPGMKGWITLLGLAVGLAAHPVGAQSPDTEATAGSTVIGDEEEAAIGLVLRPWREEAISDIDRPPRINDLRPEALAIEDVQARNRQYEVLREFQRTQPHRR